jgi:hypothetical protein
MYYGSNGQKYNDGSASAYGTTFTTNDVIGVAVDLDNGKIWWSKNGTWQASGDPEAGTNAAFTGLSGSYVTQHGGPDGHAHGNLNFGQRPFAYTAPSGFKALCTQNLPEPTIVDGGEYFNTVLYTGNGSTQNITGVGFQPDWVWAKSRSSADANFILDAVRGATNNLYTNGTAAEFTQNTVTAFNADGFSVGSQANGVNTSSATYVAWNWKANGAGVSNTDGSITSTVSANTDAGFSIVTYTGNATAGATVGHGLGVAPAMIIVKDRDGAYDWYVYHDALAVTNVLRLSDTTAAYADQQFNQQDPTSSIFYLGNNVASNTSGHRYVAYCFAPISGYSAMGSFVGNGSTDGPFIFTNFRPRWVLIKASSAVTNWWIWDTARNTFNVMNAVLYPDLSNAEYSDPSTFLMDALSNGFKYRTSNSTVNGNGTTYIYAAFAENPFKYSLAR